MKWRVILFALALFAATTPRAASVSASASDATYGLMASINQARADRGLVPLRADPRLWDIATQRAGRMATTGILSHDVAGLIPEDLAVQSVDWFGYGEVIGYAYGSANEAAASILSMWLVSPDHWPLLLSADYNYLGVGLAYRPGSGATYASVIMTESPDGTGARASVAGALISGNDIRWSWRGSDPPLQTRTSGLRDFTVQLRTDHGTWVTIGSGLTSTARSTPNRLPGHWYGLRVRARDRAGNVGPWSRELRVWLP